MVKSPCAPNARQRDKLHGALIIAPAIVRPGLRLPQRSARRVKNRRALIVLFGLRLSLGLGRGFMGLGGMTMGFIGVLGCAGLVALIMVFGRGAVGLGRLLVVVGGFFV